MILESIFTAPKARGWWVEASLSWKATSRFSAKGIVREKFTAPELPEVLKGPAVPLRIWGGPVTRYKTSLLPAPKSDP
jgi:hypothetical protein